MLFKVHQLKTLSLTPFRFDLKAFPRLAKVLDLETIEIEGTVSIKKKDRSLELFFDYQLEAQAKCRRCLEALPLKKHYQFALEIFPAETFPASISPMELKIESLDQDIYEGDEFTLEKYLEDHLLLELPEELLCQEDCLGLCLDCGQNLNLGTCACHQEKNSNPFKGLKFSQN